MILNNGLFFHFIFDNLIYILYITYIGVYFKFSFWLTSNPIQSVSDSRKIALPTMPWRIVFMESILTEFNERGQCFRADGKLWKSILHPGCRKSERRILLYTHSYNNTIFIPLKVLLKILLARIRLIIRFKTMNITKYSNVIFWGVTFNVLIEANII